MISESLNPPGEPIDKMTALPCIEGIGPQFPRRFVAGEPVAGTAPHRVGHRPDGPLLPPPGGQPLLEGREGGTLGAGRRMSPLRQPGAQDMRACAALP